MGTDDEGRGELDDRNCVVVFIWVEELKTFVVVGSEVGELDGEFCVVLVITEEVLRF